MMAELARLALVGSPTGRGRKQYDPGGSIRVALVEALARLDERVPMTPALGPVEFGPQIVSGKIVVDQSSRLRPPPRAGMLAPVADRVPVTLLEPALRHRDAQIRADAVMFLGAWGERAPLEWIMDALADRDDKVRIQALLTLPDLGARAAPLLVAALADGDRRIHRLAAGAMGRLGDAAPIEPLLAVAQDGDAEVRKAAWDSLHALGTRVPMDAALAALRDDNYWVRWQAIRALETFGDQAPIAALVAALLSDGDSLVRSRAAHVLEAQGDRAPVEPLVAASRDPDPSVRAAAVTALAAFGEQAPRESIRAALHDEANPVRKVAVAVLGRLDALDALPLLVWAVEDADAEVRVAAVEALAALGEQAPLAPLVAALDDEDLHVQAAALDALGRLGERAPVDTLVATLGHSIYLVRLVAARALMKTHPEAVLAVVSEAEAIVRGEAPGAVLGSILHSFVADGIGTLAAEGATIPPVLVERLVALLDWPYWEVRVKAIQALGKLSPPLPETATEKLRALQHDATSRAVRVAATQVLTARREPGWRG
jgi:HEAT repeat protein